MHVTIPVDSMAQGYWASMRLSGSSAAALSILVLVLAALLWILSGDLEECWHHWILLRIQVYTVVHSTIRTSRMLDQYCLPLW